MPCFVVHININSIIFLRYSLRMLDLYRYTDIEILAYTEKTNNRVTILCRAVINVFKYCRDGQTERELQLGDVWL